MSLLRCDKLMTKIPKISIWEMKTTALSCHTYPTGLIEREMSGENLRET